MSGFEILMMLGVLVILPIALTIWHITSPGDSKTEYCLNLLMVIFLLAFLFMAGTWAPISYYARTFIIGICALAIFIVTIQRIFSPKGKPWFRWHQFMFWFNSAIYLMLVGVFGLNTYAAYQGKIAPEGAIALSFPLKDGTYYVSHGGANPIINYHNEHEPQQYALDILKLNAYGRNAHNIRTNELDDYEIFGDTLYSPCDGEVIAASDGIEDATPAELQRAQPAGNHVIVRCGTIDVILAHIMQSTVAVKAGDIVTTDTVIGSVGNSGNSTEPHLHIHAVKERPLNNVLGGIGVPMVFGQHFLVRNDLVTYQGEPLTE